MKGAHGQSIILVTLVLAALFAFVAVAVDGARMFAMRRQMQNAADAGALAGAFEVCRQGKKQSVKAEAVRFAELNGADTVAAVVGRDNTVGVVAEVTFDTFFAGIIGFRELTVGAVAVAQCDGSTVRLIE